jgi:transcriptional adapter 2-alpha
MHALLKPFARYSSPEEHQRLIDGLIEEKKLRARIEELKQYRRLGFKSFN